MIKRNGEITGEITTCLDLFEDRRFEWEMSGECFNDKVQFDTIAVHTLPDTTP